MLTVIVRDKPVTQGSKVPFISRSTGRPGMKEQLGADLKTWREAVKTAAREAIEAHQTASALEVLYPLTSPVVLGVTFTLYKPSSAPKRRPTWPMGKKNDVDKLLRSTLDALTAAGVWTDDGQVVEVTRLGKFYPNPDDRSVLPDGARNSGIMLAMGGTRCDVLSVPGAVIRVASIYEFPGVTEGA